MNQRKRHQGAARHRNGKKVAAGSAATGKET